MQHPHAPMHIGTSPPLTQNTHIGAPPFTPAATPTNTTPTTTAPSTSSSRPRSGSTSAAASSSSGPRRMVSDYIVQDKIGSGSFASVWRGHHKTTNLLVAIKSVSKDKIMVNKKHQENLDMEITIMSRVTHPNIVKLYEVKDTPRHKYLILEYCAGGDLSKYIRRSGAMPERVAKGFLGQLAAGLMFLRQANLIHRDLKPQNLLLDVESPDAVLKIADFGFARYMEPNNLAATLCGSPLYMAPEVLGGGAGGYDASVDLWSVGGILFEMVTGKPPFTGQNHIQLLNRINTTEVKFPAGLNLSAPLVNLLTLLLKRNPRERITFDQFFAHPFVVEAMAIAAQTVQKRTQQIEAQQQQQQQQLLLQQQQTQQLAASPTLNAAASSIIQSLKTPGLSSTPPNATQQLLMQQQQQHHHRNNSNLYGSSPQQQNSFVPVPQQQQQHQHHSPHHQSHPSNSPPSPSFLNQPQTQTPPTQNAVYQQRSPPTQQVGFQTPGQQQPYPSPSSFSPPSPGATPAQLQQQQHPRPISRHNTPQYLRSSASGGLAGEQASTSSLGEYVLVDNNANSQRDVRETPTHTLQGNGDDFLPEWKDQQAYLQALWSRGGTYAKLADTKLTSLLTGFLASQSAAVVTSLLDDLKLTEEPTNTQLSIGSTAPANSSPQKLLLDAVTLYVKGFQIIQAGRDILPAIVAASTAGISQAQNDSPTMRENHEQRLAIQSRFDLRYEQFRSKADRVRRAVEELQAAVHASTIRLGSNTHSRRASGNTEGTDESTHRSSPSLAPNSPPLVTDCAEKLMFDSALDTAKQMVHALFVGDTHGALKAYEHAVKMLDVLIKDERSSEKDRRYFQEISQQLTLQYQQHTKTKQHVHDTHANNAVEVH